MKGFENAIKCLEGDIFAFELRKMDADRKYCAGNNVSKFYEETIEELKNAIEVLKNHEE